jgi:pyruvate/2-oxoglutarate dehydrogenase complex dihydrolipoamide dehydrogenase (E3) component
MPTSGRARNAGNPLSTHFDVVILGGGSAGEVVAEELGGSGLRIAVVEQGRVGGICPFLACMPSKALLRSAGARRLAALAHGLGAVSAPLDLGDAGEAYARAVRRRDDIADRRDDAEHAESLEEQGASLVRGKGRIERPGSLRVEGEDGSELDVTFEKLVIATGSRPAVPPVKGLDSGAVPLWTSDDALSASFLPERLVVLGGGAIGCELALGFRRFGSAVTLVEPAEQLLGPEEPAVASALADVLRAEGIEVLLGAGAAFLAEGEVVLEDGRRIGADRLLVATGRNPATGGLGLERLGVEPGEDGEVPTDSRCAVPGADGVFACGDVTGKVPFTHGAKHQARVVAANLRVAAGLSDEAAETDLDAVPRVVFTDPPVASVGLSRTEAESRGIEVACAAMDLAETARADAELRLLDRPDPQAGILVLVADRARRTLVGASAIGPAADEWIGEATLAVCAAVPLATLARLVHPFPTFSEAYEPALRQLAAEVSSGSAVS